MYVRHCRSGMARSGMARISVDEEKEESREAVRGESAHTSLKTHCLQYVWSGASVEPNFVGSCQQAGSCQQQRCKLVQRTRCVLRLSFFRAAGPKRLRFGFAKLSPEASPGLLMEPRAMALGDSVGSVTPRDPTRSV